MPLTIAIQGKRRAGMAVLMLLVLALPLASLAPRNVAAAGTYYVSTTGSDATGSGSLAQPWRTIQKAAVGLKEAGAERVFACAVHAVLSGPAIDRIEKSPIDQLIVTNTIALNGLAQQCRKIEVLSVARLLGQAIRNIHEETSVSSLFV